MSRQKIQERNEKIFADYCDLRFDFIIPGEEWACLAEYYGLAESTIQRIVSEGFKLNKIMRTMM